METELRKATLQAPVAHSENWPVMAHWNPSFLYQDLGGFEG